MCLSVDAYGSWDGEGSRVSVYVYLMQGDNDDNLKWPALQRHHQSEPAQPAGEWEAPHHADSCGHLMLMSLKMPVNVSQEER